jgi:hypothetical protein
VKYKDRYQCVRHPGYSVGRFYTSDLRKIASLQQHYKFMFPDLISHDPIRFLKKLMMRENCLFYSVKNEKLVEGYGLSVLLDASRIVEFHTFRKKLPFSLLRYKKFVETQLEFLFEEIGVRKIYSRIPSKLNIFVELSRRLGFSIEGILRKDSIYDEERMDMVIIGMLKEEF